MTSHQPPSSPVSPGASLLAGRESTIARHSFWERLVFQSFGRLPSRMTILELGNAVFYPGAVMPLSLQHRTSMETARIAFESHMPLVVLSVAATENHNFIGCASQVKKLATAPAGGCDVVVQGICRVLGRRRGTVSESLAADVVVRPDEPAGADAVRGMQRLRDVVEEIIKLLPTVPEQAVALMEAIQDPGHLADILAANIDGTLEQKQAVLECADVVRRQALVFEMLVSQRDVLLAQRQLATEG